MSVQPSAGCYAVWKPATNPHHHTLYYITSQAGSDEVQELIDKHPGEVKRTTRPKFQNLVKKAYYRTNVRKTYLVLSDETDNPELGAFFKDGSVFRLNHKYSYVFYEPSTGNRYRAWTQHGKDFAGTCLSIETRDSRLFATQKGR